MKKFLMFICVLVVAMCLSGCGGISFRDTKPGETVVFGNYAGEPIEWLCLAQVGNSKLLLTKRVIEGKNYHDEDRFVTWEHCTLRKWLNTSFYNVAFDKNEKGKIVTVKNDNFRLYQFDSIGGNDTQDKVFCLSVDELEKYCDKDFRRCSPTEHAKKGKVAINEGYLSIHGVSVCDWYLRTVFNSDKLIFEVPSVPESCFLIEHGCLYGSARNTHRFTGVRPAIWVSAE